MSDKQEKAIIDILKEYFQKNCTYVKGLKVDYLSEEESWSLEQGANPIVLKKDVLGNRHMQLTFTLATRISVNSITDENQRKILKAFSDISEWMYEMTQKKVLPTLNDREASETLEATSNAFLFAVNKDNTQARYEMPCKFTYKKLKGE